MKYFALLLVFLVVAAGMIAPACVGGTRLDVLHAGANAVTATGGMMMIYALGRLHEIGASAERRKALDP